MIGYAIGFVGFIVFVLVLLGLGEALASSFD